MVTRTKKALTVKAKAEHLPLKEHDIKNILVEVQKRGYYVALRPEQHRGRVIKADTRRWAGGAFKFAVISCTHLGSRYQQLTALYDFYSLCAKEKVDTVFHCGDVTDGENMWRGHQYDLFAQGHDAQAKYTIDNYPLEKGITTKMISGNHDASFWRHAGVNVVKTISKERPDMIYMGDSLAFVDIGKIRLAIMHGEGGVAYARSYKAQKIVEQVASENKPHFFFLGHYHVPAMIPGYRNVETVQMGCFQAQTPYLVAKGLQPHVSGLIVSVVPDDKGIGSVDYKWVPFYVHRKNDF